ncbi:MAG: flagellin [Candidatus Zixiibacteriota bacterium]
MSIRINRDISAGESSRGINRSYKSLMKTMEKLSSGLRINRASDDPAGLVISEKMRSRIASLNQEIENTSHAIRKYETADATIGELRSNLTELRKQALGASNEGFNFESTQDAYQAAAQNAVGNYNNVIATASYNGRNMLDGGEGSLADLSQLEGIDLSTPENASAAIAQIDEAMAELDAAQVEIGATQKNELETRRSNLEVTAENLTASESQIRDTDYMKELANQTRDELNLKSGVAMQAHANLSKETVLKLLE